MEIGKITLSDESAYRRFEADLLEESKVNPFIEISKVDDFKAFVAENESSGHPSHDQGRPAYSQYFTFVNGDIAGFVICFWDKDNQETNDLGEVGFMISKDYRRQGIATQLVTRASRIYQEKGYDRFSMVTDRDNIPSCRFIESLGGQLEKVAEIDYFGQKKMSAKYWLEV